MSDLRKAAEMALEALRNAEVVYMEQINAMYALQEALAQPEQETKRDGDSEFLAGVEWAAKAIESKLPKREWVGLTQEEVDALLWKLSVGAVDEDVRTIEAKLKEKNA